MPTTIRAIMSGSITIPAHVRYEVSTHKTAAFLAKNPSLASDAQPQNYTATAVKFDASGNEFTADLGNGSADAGAQLELKDPSDATLNYSPAQMPGYGNNANQTCPLLPAFLGLLAIAVFLKRR